MRSKDKPGEYRIREQPDGSGWRVSGMKLDGQRVRQKFGNKSEAEMYATLNFTKPELDDWGLPMTKPAELRMPETVVASVNASMGVTPQTVPKVEEKPKDREEAMMLSELLGTGWAAGTVLLGKKVVDNVGKDPDSVNPDSKQVNKLAKTTTKTIQGWFGDREIKPWIMMVLLTFGIIITMLIQAKPKKEKPNHLQSVP